jgi:voltage-gated potassium channel
MFLLHVLAMVLLEDMPAGDALWLTFVTVTTIGYGDVAAKTAGGRAATVLFAMIGCVFVAAKLASDWFDWRETVQERRRRGSWRWDMRDHVLVIGTPCGDALRFFRGLVRQLQGSAAYGDAPVQLLTRAFDQRPEGLPAVLQDMGVVHSSGGPTDPDALAAADAGRARAVILLADREDDPVSDAVAMDVLARLRMMAAAEGRAPPAIVAECVDDRNRERLRAAGCAAAVRPLRAYPELVVRALVAPGSQMLLEDLFNAEGDELHRLALPAPWHGRWTDIACAMLRSGIGTAIAYEATDGRVHLNPGPSAPVEAAALFVIVSEGAEETLPARVHELLRPPLPAPA